MVLQTHGHYHNADGLKYPLDEGTSPSLGSNGVFAQMGINKGYSNISIKSATTGISMANTGGGQPVPNVQPSLVINKIIKVK